MLLVSYLFRMYAGQLATLPTIFFAHGSSWDFKIFEIVGGGCWANVLKLGRVRCKKVKTASPLFLACFSSGTCQFICQDMLFVLALLTFPDVIYSLPDDRSIILLLSAFFLSNADRNSRMWCWRPSATVATKCRWSRCSLKISLLEKSVHDVKCVFAVQSQYHIRLGFRLTHCVNINPLGLIRLTSTWFNAGVHNLFAIAGRITFIFMSYGRQWVPVLLIS